MDLQKEITKLVQYGLDHELIQPEDKIYTINQYLQSVSGDFSSG